ncbi:hypothetical protein [Aquimarina sp. I32.4]|uniref:hypothetical protein n=1 Tax=Aquimarina sp. I32.4 TaxID=2053903 RepID=UPI000CDE806D|nr:hypothetical protein [Aquimarina sp. I32.4]
MIQHTKFNLIALLTLLIFINCKQNKDNISGLPSLNKKSAKTNSYPQSDLWRYYQVYPIGNQKNEKIKDVENKFKNLSFYIEKDMIFISDIGEETIYRGKIKTKKFLKYPYMVDYYKSLLKKEFNTNLNDTVTYIRNKNTHKPSSILKNIFNEAFITKQYLFFEYNGVVICLLNKSRSTPLKYSSSKNQENKILYRSKININNIDYRIYEKDLLLGAEDWLCDQKQLRYIELPHKGNLKIILVPQDCGDFPYRFFLLTIRENKILSNLYVEGEWYEPGDEEAYKELTSFEIKTDYTIITTTTSYENGEIVNKSIKEYHISDSGKIKEQ